jgi:hypothetical protein
MFTPVGREPMAQPGHPECKHASRHVPPQRMGGTGLSQFKRRTSRMKLSLRGSNREE